MEYPLKGRGAQINPVNRFNSQSLSYHVEGIDEPLFLRNLTRYYIENSVHIISRNTSPDIPFEFSINPYQGCEHGCAYCYARNSHEYWGFSSGLDFETHIIIKPKAPELLSKVFLSKSWKPASITLSGNTDCYQPIENKLKITRRLLEVFNDFKNPVSIITKNVLLLRDLDILTELATDKLVHIFISITTLDENLRQMLEPRTASTQKKFEVISKLSEQGIPVGVMVGPVIPGLNNQEIPQILKLAEEKGASSAGMNILRMNGSVAEVFKDWLHRNLPDRYTKILNQVSEVHGGQVSDSKWGRRIRGEGNIADAIKFTFNKAKEKYYSDKSWPQLNHSLFRKSGNLNLF